MMVIAGHNGAGKSTCYREYLADTLGGNIKEHIDPDVIERAIRTDFREVGEEKSDKEFSRLAQVESNRLRNHYFDNRIAFSFETVFSDTLRDKVNFIKEAVESGYLVALLAVGLDSPEKSRQRVKLRVQRGGHNVPPEKIVERYPRVIYNIKEAVGVVSLALVVDNSEDNLGDNDGAYRAFALFVNGKMVNAADDIPEWWKS